MKTKKIGLSPLKQLAKATLLTTAALFYACAPKNGANSTAPIINDNDKPVLEAFSIEQPLDFIYNKARKQIADKDNFNFFNPLQEKLTNQTKYLKIKGELEDKVVYEEKSQKKVLELEEKEKGKYFPKNFSLEDLSPGSYRLFVRHNRKPHNSLRVEIIDEDDKSICEKAEMSWNEIANYCNE